MAVCVPVPASWVRYCSFLVVTLLGPVCWLICVASKLAQESQILCSKQLALEALSNGIAFNVNCLV